MEDSSGHGLRADKWAAKKAPCQAVEAVCGWDCPTLDENHLVTVVQQLVTAAVADGGKRVSVPSATRTRNSSSPS